MCGTERHAQEIIALPFPFPCSFFLPPVCESLLTYNPNSFDRDYGVLMRDRKEAGKEWVWGNEAAMSSNDLWAILFPSFSPHWVGRVTYRFTEKLYSYHTESDHWVICWNWICNFSARNNRTKFIRYEERTRVGNWVINANVWAVWRQLFPPQKYHIITENILK